MNRPTYYNFFWRWHFYAGLIAMPIILIMAITGALYLLQPQIENLAYKKLIYLEKNFQETPNHDAIIQAAKQNFPVKKINSYQPPIAVNQSAQVVFTTEDERKITVFIHPETLATLGTIDESWRLMNIARNLHKNLMLGNIGRIITELTACWLIVMILSGIYLWWPRGDKNRGTIVPNIKTKDRKIWREFHGVSGAWVSVWILLLLFSGLPWSFVWGGLLGDFSTRAGEGFPKAIFKERPMSMSSADLPDISMNQLLQIVSKQEINHQFKIEYPWWEKGSYALIPLRHGGDVEDIAFLFFDRKSSKIIDQYRFEDLGKIGKLTAIGVAFHEGRLFGSTNQILNLSAILLLLGLMISGFAMWLKRKPQKSLGAPPIAKNLKLPKRLIFLIILIGIFLPLFGASVLLILLGEQLFKKLKKQRIKE
jgi:uncharacterized iron-regulated membrane protein